VSESRKIAAILASDVVGYSRLAGADEEQGRKDPDAAARAYLVVIGRNPAAVSEALHPTP
jgi:hypothetical protein